MNDSFENTYRPANWRVLGHKVRTPYNGSKNTRYQQSTHPKEEF